VRTREPGKHPATRTFQALRMSSTMRLGQLEKVWLPRWSFSSRRTVGRHQPPLARGSSRQTLHEAADRNRSGVGDLPVLPVVAEPRLKLVGRKSRAVAKEVDSNPARSQRVVARRREN